MQRWTRIWGIVSICALIGSGVASAQEGYSFSASLAGGVAGAFDTDGSHSFDELAFQAGFGMFTSERTMTVVRLGRFELDSERSFNGLFDAELDFVNVSGEYRFRQAAYDFGLFVGVGAYRMSGEGSGGSSDRTALGAALGFTGDFDVTRRFSIVAEIDFHYVFFDDENLYGTALAGVAVHF